MSTDAQPDGAAVTRILRAAAILDAKNRRIEELEGLTARLDQDNAAAHHRIAELEEAVAAYRVTLSETEVRAAGMAGRLAEWEACADTLGPVGRPHRW